MIRKFRRLQWRFTTSFILILTISMLASCGNNQGTKTFKNMDVADAGAHIKNLETKTNAPVETIKIPKDLEKTLPLSKVIDSVWYIQLETNHSSIMGNISQIIPYKDRFFIFDSESVFIFNSEGEFLHKISNHGKGPGEYVLPLFFTIDKSKDEILIYDDKVSKILYFDLNGKWLREQFIKYRFSEFSILKDGSYVLHSYKRYNNHIPEIENYQLLTADAQWNLLGRASAYVANRQSGSNILSGGTLGEHDGVVTYFPPFRDTVYSVTTQGLTPRYAIDFGKRKLPENFDYDITGMEFLNKYNNSEYAYSMGDNRDMEDFIFLKIKYKKSNVYGFYSKNTKKFFCSNTILIDLKCLGFPPPEASLRNNVLISYIDPPTILESKKQLMEVKGFSPEIKDIVQNIELHDNPVLSLYKLKDF